MCARMTNHMPVMASTGVASSHDVAAWLLQLSCGCVAIQHSHLPWIQNALECLPHDAVDWPPKSCC